MRWLWIIAIVPILLVLSATDLTALKIVDYQHKLNPRFTKIVRKSTRFIIIHSTEGSLPSSLRTLSRGKFRRKRYVSRGGHAHYLIAKKDGTVYRILNPKYRANHAGVSMWNGVVNLSNYSLGIELEGYHNIPFTDRQYQSLRELLRILQKRYRIKDRDVLEHYRVAYSEPNRFNDKRLRGRKKDPGIDNFDRKKAGLMDAYPQDPDVIAGRVSRIPDPVQVARNARLKPVSPTLAENDRRTGRPPKAEKVRQAGGEKVKDYEKQNRNGRPDSPDRDSVNPNIITTRRTAWKIAGHHYKAASTLYRFPDGRSLRGHEIQDWSNIPPGTQVELEVEEAKMVSVNRAEVLLPTVTKDMSPWKIANALHNSSFTYYIYPNGNILAGHRIKRFSDVPLGTRVLIAYRRVPTPRTRSLLGEDLEDVFLSYQTLYLFPSGALKSGEQIENFAQLPREAIVFARVE